MDCRSARAAIAREAGEFTGCSELDYPGGIATPAEIVIRQISLAQTRPMRHTVLRPHQSLADLERAEPEDAYAVGAFRGEELIADELRVADGPLRFEFHGNCGYASRFDYRS